MLQQRLLEKITAFLNWVDKLQIQIEWQNLCKEAEPLDF